MIKPSTITLNIKSDGSCQICKKDRERINLWHANNAIFDVMLFNVGFVAVLGTAKVLIKMLLAAIM